MLITVASLVKLLNKLIPIQLALVFIWYMNSLSSSTCVWYSVVEHTVKVFFAIYGQNHMYIVACIYLYLYTIVDKHVMYNVPWPLIDWRYRIL